MIRQVCCYCNAYLGSIEEHGDGDDVERISHGVCPDCFPRLVAGTGITWADVMNSLPAPVLVVDQNEHIIAGNSQSQQLNLKEFEETKDHLEGEVFNCKDAHLPGGCGQKVHCKTCTIRRTVTSTFEHGNPNIRVPAYMDLGDRTGLKEIRFYISTEKVGGAVMLRIDDTQQGH